MKKINANTNNTVSRRKFMKTSAAVVSGVSLLGFGCSKSSVNPPGDILKVIAFNTFKGSPWPIESERAKKAYEKGQMSMRIALELELHSPEVVTFAEAPAKEEIQYIANYLNMNYVLFPSGNADAWPGALLTHYEILHTENAPVVGGERPDDLFTRHWGKVIVRLKNGDEITIHSAHLNPHNDRDNRQREIGEILKSVQEDMNNGKSMLIMGDLNHRPDMPEYDMWIDAGWTDTFAVVGEGNGGTARPDSPTRRIDYVLAYGPIANKIVESRPLFEGAFRTNPNDSSSFALSDHLPQYAAFEIDI